MSNKIKLPEIFTANTYFWYPGSSASQRRSNERRRLQEAKSFFEFLGWEVSEGYNCVTGNKGNWFVTFHYSESCRNVYKSVDYTYEDNGSPKKHNVIKFLNDFEFHIIQ